MVRAVKFSPGCTFLAAAGDDQTIALYDVVNGEHIANWTGHGAWIMSLDWSSTGEFLLSGYVWATCIGQQQINPAQAPSMEEPKYGLLNKESVLPPIATRVRSFGLSNGFRRPGTANTLRSQVPIGQ